MSFSRRQYPSIRSIIFSATGTEATLIDKRYQRGQKKQDIKHRAMVQIHWPNSSELHLPVWPPQCQCSRAPCCRSVVGTEFSLSVWSLRGTQPGAQKLEQQWVYLFWVKSSFDMMKHLLINVDLFLYDMLGLENVFQRNYSLHLLLHLSHTLIKFCEFFLI